ncbi:MAG: T9SS type A sorting domain-containing protein [Bacteroidales bacterium]|jgi:hypothetical protein|nr:T9SS type A sorting domain-containing protein [Bacteroidales bacterium]
MNIKKTVLINICLVWMGFTVPTCAQSNDYLYVHHNNVATRSFALDELQKIVVTDENIRFHDVNSSVATLLYDEVSILTFEDEPLISKSNEVAALYDKINVYYNSMSDVVTISSISPIKEVALFSAQGALLKKINAKSLSVEMFLSGYSSGIYLIKAADAQGIVVKKIIKHI